MTRIASRTWTPNLVIRLKEMLETKVSAAQVAVALKKSTVVVRAKAKILGLIFQQYKFLTFNYFEDSNGQLLFF
jgi:hypothetical protein